MKISNKIASSREIGTPEAISHLLGFPDHYTSGKFSTIHTTRLLQHIRDLHQSKGLNSSLDDDGKYGDAGTVEVADGNLVLHSPFDDYAYRGNSLEYFCLYDYRSMFYSHKAKYDGIPFRSDHPLHQIHRQFLRSESSATIPALLGYLLTLNPHSNDASIIDDYYCILVALFIPWEGNLPFKLQDISWEDFILAPRLQRFIDNLILLHRSQEEARMDALQRKQMEGDDDDDHDQDPDHDADHPNDLDAWSDEEEDDDWRADWLQSYDVQAVEAAFLQSVNTSDPYVAEAIDANFDYGYLSELHDNVATLPASDTASASSTHYSTVPADQLFDSIKQMRRKGHEARRQPSTATTGTEPHIFISDNVDHAHTMAAIINIFSLNEKQQLAFHIVTDHTLGSVRFGKQLRMGIFGEGGTGKSRLIEAIRAWFIIISRENELVVTATTGAAACNIGGVTIHSALGISGKETGEDHWTRRLTPKKYEEWKSRRYIIIDEVSMVSWKTMMQVNSQLGKATGNNEEDFGGINVLLLGDFLQLPVVKNYNLYERKMVWEKGNDLWRSQERR